LFKDTFPIVSPSHIELAAAQNGGDLNCVLHSGNLPARFESWQLGEVLGNGVEAVVYNTPYTVLVQEGRHVIGRSGVVRVANKMSLSQFRAEVRDLRAIQKGCPAVLPMCAACWYPPCSQHSTSKTVFVMRKCLKNMEGHYGPDSREPRSWLEVRDVLGFWVAALGAAERRVVFGDLKLGNLVVDEEGGLHMIDVG
jgi:aminoglycoside phosphotransferase (APT) family kinase protein